MRKRLKLFFTGTLIRPVRAMLGTPAADFGEMICQGQNGENGPVFSKTINSAPAR